MILSRLKDEEARKGLDISGDGWTRGCAFLSPTVAINEFNWLLGHNPAREYKLIARVKKEEFDDELPF